MVCSLGTNATTTTAPDDVLGSTMVYASRDSVTMATSGGVGVASSRCELTRPISNASSTIIQLVFDVVRIQHVDVRHATTNESFSLRELAALPLD